MAESFVDRIKDSVLVLDGAMGTMLYAKGVYINRCYDELNLSAPDMVQEVHEMYLAAGAEVLETNTFGANPVKLDPHGLGEQVEESDAPDDPGGGDGSLFRTLLWGLLICAVGEALLSRFMGGSR